MSNLYLSFFEQPSGSEFNSTELLQRQMFDANQFYIRIQNIKQKKINKFK